jgi:cytoskeletal protein RodZ
MHARSRLAVTAVALLVIVGCGATEDTAPTDSIDPLSGQESTTTSVTTASTTDETVPTTAPTTAAPTTAASAASSTEPPTTAAPPPTEPPTTAAPTTAAPAAVSYKNCDEARAAGAAPLYQGEPGYSSKLDRDGDGVACE